MPSLVVTSYVIDEIVTFFNSRGHHAKAVQVAGSLLSSRTVKIVHVDEPLFFEGWDYFQRHQDKAYSLTDCISFLVMERNDIEVAWTFDRHFVQAGFLMEP